MTEEQPAVQVQQPAPQPPKKKKGMSENAKSWLTFGSIAVIAVAGGAYLLLLGSEQDTLSKKLAAEIKAWEGKGYQQKLEPFIENQMTKLGYGNAEELKIVKEMLGASDSTLTFSEIKPFSDSEFGGVNIASAVLKTSAAGIDGGPGLGSQEDTYNNVVIKQTVTEPNKYLFAYNAESKQFDGSQQPMLITKMDGADGYVEFNADNSFKGTEGKFQKVTFTDGSGSMTYATLENLYSKFIYDPAGSFEIAVKADKIIPGDTIKMMLGDLQPIQLSLDWAYNGDPITKLQKIADENPDGIKKFMEAEPEALLAEMGTAEKYNGHVNFKDFTIMSGTMGFQAKADLKFTNFPFQPVPVGSVNFSIKDYNAIIAYARNFMPIPQEEIDKELFEMKEYFTDNGKDLDFVLTLDGTRKAKFGTGKEIDLLEEYNKEDAASIAPSPNAEAGPLETEVKSEAAPVSVPEVQQRELGNPADTVPASTPAQVPATEVKQPELQ